MLCLAHRYHHQSSKQLRDQSLSQLQTIPLIEHLFEHQKPSHCYKYHEIVLLTLAPMYFLGHDCSDSTDLDLRSLSKGSPVV